LRGSALSPAGAWERDWADRKRLFKTLRRLPQDTRRSRPILPALARSARFRHWALRHSAVHGQRVSPAGLLELADDTIACRAADDLLASSEQLEPLDPPPCPITLAWSAGDRMFPTLRYRPRAKELVPEARSVVLEGVGHVPMLDDPDLVARTILRAPAGVG
jgi:pimeloyl-ACP methyl ester carboxylesterase